MNKENKNKSKKISKKIRAENETRTRDPNLGKVVLYQLSYFRILFSESPQRSQILPRLSPISNFLGQGCALPTELFPQLIISNNSLRALIGPTNDFCSEEEETRTPTSQLTLPPQSSASTNSATSPLQVFLMPYGAQNRSRTCTPRGTRT